MDCSKASLLMMEYIDGSICKSEKDDLMKHLESCYECSEEFSLIKESLDLVENMEEIEPPENIEELVMSNIDVKKYKEKSVNTNIIIALITMLSIVGIVLFTITRLKVDFLREIFVSFVISTVNVMVIILPKIMSFVEGNFILIIGIGMLILLAFIGSLLTVAVTEVYFIKKINLRRS